MKDIAAARLGEVSKDLQVSLSGDEEKLSVELDKVLKAYRGTFDGF